MPLRARLVVLAYAGFYLLACALALIASFLWVPLVWVNWVLAGALLALTILLLDAFHPRVGLFARAWHEIPQQDGEKTIALTFDDGPVQPYTAQILDILDRYGVKASFFCIGENVRKKPEIARQIVRRGHTLGNHTQTHDSLLLAGTRRIAREVGDAQQSIREACGSEPVFFRCPKGRKNPFVACSLRRHGLKLAAYGYPIWDVENPPARELVKRVLRRARPGDIVLMHDGFSARKPGKRDQLVAALPDIIEGLLNSGIKPVSLDQAISPRT